MKIAYLTRGHSIVDRRFMAKMVDRGHRPYLISYYNQPVVQVPGVDVYHYKGPLVHRLNRMLTLQRVFHLRKLLSQLVPDILHCYWMPDHGFYGALSGFHPMVAMPGGSDVLLKPDLSLRDKWIVRFALKRADKVVCDSMYVKNRVVQLASHHSDRIIVFPHGINLRVFQPATRPSCVRRQLGWEEKSVLIVSRGLNKPVYGLEYFIEALPLVVRARPDTRVILLGSGPLEKVSRTRIDQLGLGEYVHFAGPLGETEVAEHLNAADIYISTSLSDGTSVAMLEAMACRLPLVVSDVPSYFEWVENGENGFIVPRRDVECLAERLIDLLANKPLREQMGARNLQIARERADWEKNFSILESVYDSLVNARN